MKGEIMATTRKFTKADWIQLVEGIGIIVLGICLTLALLKEGIIDIILGVVILGFGVLFIALGIFSRKTVLCGRVIGGTFLVGAGIAELIEKSFSSYIGNATSWFIFLFGIFLLLNGIIILAWQRRRSDHSIFLSVSELIAGTVLTVVGALMLFPTNKPEIDPDIAWIIFGVVFILFGILLVCDLFLAPETKSDIRKRLR